MIGKIISAHVRWNSAGVWVKEREINQTEMEYQMRNWYQLKLCVITFMNNTFTI